MSAATIVIGLILIVVLLVFALMINPPESWSKRLTGKKDR
jgi:hypothetical protein